jgi:hypothetical protein
MSAQLPNQYRHQFRFEALPTSTSLLRTKRGRPVLPPPDALNPSSTTYSFTNSDLREILREVGRQRRRWRIGHYMKLTFLAAVFVWIGWLWWVVATGSAMR